MAGRKFRVSIIGLKITIFKKHYTRESLFDVTPLSQGDIVFVGDSITAGGEWEQLFHNLNVRNRGIVDDTTEGVLQRLQEINNAKPEKIFLMVGINDPIAGRTINSILSYYRQILVDVMRESPTTHIYVESVLPVNTKISPLLSSNDDVIALHNGLKETSDQLGVVYIDLYSSFVKDKQLNEAYTWDGTHLNGAGYDLWRKIVTNYVFDDSN